LDESEAIQGCHQGDRNHFKLLVERYGRVLYGTAYRMTGDRSLAEDMVQETFLRAWRAIPSFRGGSFKAWIVRILVNHVMGERRKNRMQETPLSEMQAVAGASNEGEELVLRQEERKRIRGALGHLSQEHREVVVLRYYSGLTLSEIATAIGCRQGTVKSRLHRTMGRLREMLAGGGDRTSFDEAV